MTALASATALHTSVHLTLLSRSPAIGRFFCGWHYAELISAKCGASAPFPALAPVRLPLLRCFVLRCVHPLPLSKEGFSLADWLNTPLSHDKGSFLQSLRGLTRHSSSILSDPVDPQSRVWRRGQKLSICRQKLSPSNNLHKEKKGIKFGGFGSQIRRQCFLLFLCRYL